MYDVEALSVSMCYHCVNASDIDYYYRKCSARRANSGVKLLKYHTPATAVQWLNVMA